MFGYPFVRESGVQKLHENYTLKIFSSRDTPVQNFQKPDGHIVK